MEQLDSARRNLPEPKTGIRLCRTPAGQRFFAGFLICLAVLIAAFAVGAVWYGRGGDEWLRNHGFLPEETDKARTTGTAPEHDTPGGEKTDPESTTPPTKTTDPAGPPIVERDLSYRSLGREYIHNTTVYSPDVPTLLQRKCGSGAAGGKITVLVLHTHAGEAYAPDGATALSGVPGDVTYSREETQNVLAVGETFCKELEKNGIGAVHCRTVHDAPTLRGAYDRAAESIRFYLEQYPDIRYVIDLHRDAVTDADGNYVKAITRGEDGVPLAQVMAVVGTDGNGTAHPDWERNLAIALQLRELLNAEGGELCRPVCLRNTSYNQELAPYAMLLEIGTGANSIEEARRSARIVAKTFAELISRS